MLGQPQQSQQPQQPQQPQQQSKSSGSSGPQGGGGSVLGKVNGTLVLDLNLPSGSARRESSLTSGFLRWAGGLGFRV